MPSNEGVRVEKSITIERPLEEVFDYWLDLQNLPLFLRHLKSVTVLDELHSHWAANTLGGKVVEWDAEIIECRPNEMISWRSAPGSDVDNAGSVWFAPVPRNAATVVKVVLKYIPPAGKTGDFLARIFGRDAESQIEEDLRRLKSLLETGTVAEEPGVEEWAARTAESVRDTGRQADVYLRQNPWVLLGTAAAIGLLAGLLFGGGGKPRRQPRFRLVRCEEEEE